ncbi:enoyl-CoA hydratase/isomerase family protein [Persicitalea jodogahamensis]|uniref:Enoyl-CoA hydratase n=1 Tax=Persicitalea jodogahamensis TaxID=402147 RepID=A0A8J3D7C5_9BACT|nr:enoyl-CoA hydratase/isomerase family protein [Persicitalea jodogahamensis]GHB61945.1 enoyl-CoA hydratase [Persicitalea jodogahamensis]
MTSKLIDSKTLQLIDSYVKINSENRISTVEFFHPAGNALPSGMLDQLARAIRQAGEARDSSVVVLRSGGNRAFCAGASLTELAAITSEQQGKDFFLGFAQVINAMRRCPKFIVARAQGKAVGGGVGLLTAADYCLATHHAAVKLSELTVGIGPFVIEPAVRRKIGLAATTQLTINATEFKSAIWAWQKGLFDDVLETTEELDEHVADIANRLADYEPESMRRMKQVFWEGTDHWDELLRQRAEISGTLVLSDFAQKSLTTILAGLKSG